MEISHAAVNFSAELQCLEHKAQLQRILQGSVIAPYVRDGDAGLVRHLTAHVGSRMDPFWSLLTAEQGEELLSVKAMLGPSKLGAGIYFSCAYEDILDVLRDFEVMCEETVRHPYTAETRALVLSLGGSHKCIVVEAQHGPEIIAPVKEILEMGEKFLTLLTALFTLLALLYSRRRCQRETRESKRSRRQRETRESKRSMNVEAIVAEIDLLGRKLLFEELKQLDPKRGKLDVVEPGERNLKSLRLPQEAGVELRPDDIQRLLLEIKQELDRTTPGSSQSIT